MYEQIFATKARKLVTVIGDKTDWVLVLQARSTEETMWYVLTERWEKGATMQDSRILIETRCGNI